ncbi:MAG TPA: hypothetical protein PKN62_00705 [bacterium]|nr:hypothetical protein [bacterium]
MESPENFSTQQPGEKNPESEGQDCLSIEDRLLEADKLFEKLQEEAEESSNENNKKGLFKKIFSFSAKEQEAAGDKIKDIDKNFGKELIKAKEEIEKYKKRYAESLVLANILPEGEKKLLEEKMRTEGELLETRKVECEKDLESQKEDLPNYAKKIETIETCLIEYNDVAEVISEKRFETAIKIAEAEGALNRFKKSDAQMAEPVQEILDELKKQQLKFDCQYREVRQRINMLQDDRLENKRYLAKINGLGKTSAEIAQEIADRRSKERAIEENKKSQADNEKKETAPDNSVDSSVDNSTNSSSENQPEDQSKEKTKKKSEKQTKTKDNKNKNKKSEANQTAKPEQEIDLQKLEIILKGEKRNIFAWVDVFKGLNQERKKFFAGLQAFVEEKKDKAQSGGAFDIKKTKIDGIEMRTLAIDYSVEVKNLKQDEATEKVNSLLYKLVE